jgi:hypothetical protein
MLGRFISAKRYAELLVQGQGNTAAMYEIASRNKASLLNESRSARTPAFRRLPLFAYAFEARTGLSGVDSPI